MSDFPNYIDSTLETLNGENKEIYLCGDFDIDLLKIQNEVPWNAE